MPTTRLKNAIYHTALPFLAPSVRKQLTLQSKGIPHDHEQDLTAILSRHHVFGAALQMEKNGKCATVYESLREPRRVVSESTVFRAASLTKTASALGILRLCEKGSMDLDEEINAFLPQAHSILKGITLRHILSHRSGLRDTPLTDQVLRDEGTYMTVLDDPNIQYSVPDRCFLYCNFAYGLLGCAIEHVTGEGIAEAMEHLIFAPLAMNATLDRNQVSVDRLLLPVRVLPYAVSSLSRNTPHFPPDIPSPLTHFGYTQGALYVTCESYARLLRCIARGGMCDSGVPLVSAASIAQMKAEHSTYGAASPTLSYGLGLLIVRDSRLSPHALYGHQGFAYGSVHGAFFDEENCITFLTGGASEERIGMMGRCNLDILTWALEEMKTWKL